MKNRLFFTKQNIRTVASLNLNSNMKTKTYIQFFSSNFDVLLEQNNPDLAVPFSSKTNITYCVPVVHSALHCSHRHSFAAAEIRFLKGSENYLKIVNHGENLVGSQSSDLCLQTWTFYLGLMMWWQLWKLSSFKMNDLWSTCRFWLTHRAQPCPHLKIVVFWGHNWSC